jgi:VWFA-related protein
MALFPALRVCVTISLAAHTPQASDFATLLTQYRGTDADAALRQLAAWPDSRIFDTAKLATVGSDPWNLAAAALFHLEAGLMDVGHLPGDAHIVAQGHFRGALNAEGRARILDVMAKAKVSRDKALFEFLRDYHIVVGVVMAQSFQPSSEPARQALRILGEDAAFQLAVGAHAALAMGPRRVGDGPYGLLWGTPQQPARLISAGGEHYNADEAREAELAFRRAIALDPTLAEAHLRLGRVYQLINRPANAQRELEAAARDARQNDNALTAYLAELFLGQLHEDAGRSSDALNAYERAIITFPAGYAARLALGHTLLAAGRTEEGWAMRRSVLGADLQPPARDPWGRFPAPNYGRITDRLAAMRAKVSKTPLRGAPTPTQPTRGSMHLSPLLEEPTAPPQSRVPVFRASVQSVRVEVLVLDNGRPVTGLEPRDFTVSDNGVPQRVDAVALAQSVAVAVVVDTSRSMGHATQWPIAQRAVRGLQKALTPADTFSLLTVSDRLALRGDLLRNPDLLPMLLAPVAPEVTSRSSLWDGVFAGAALVAESPGRAVVALISDGWDNASWFERPRAFKRLQRLGLPVDAIAVPFQTSNRGSDIVAGDVSLRPLEALTGGSVTDGTDVDLDRQLADRFAMLRQSYILTYTPQNVKPQKDGWHEIKVTLRSGVKGKVQARPGYYARPR